MIEPREALAYPSIGLMFESTHQPKIELGYFPPEVITSFMPSDEDVAVYGQYQLINPRILDKPHDIPEHHIAYNPSALWDMPDASGNIVTVGYVRCEPDSSNAGESHLGKTKSRPYVFDLENPHTPLRPFDNGMELDGEDPSLTHINRLNPVTGKLEPAWLVSTVVAEPDPEQPNIVKTFYTTFHVGSTLNSLEPIMEGPENDRQPIRIPQKDVRVKLSNPNDTRLEIYGRPQAVPGTGNISHTTIDNLDQLSTSVVINAPVISHNLLPVGSGVWGGVNDVIRVADGKFVLAAHRAYRIGEDGRGRHYETVLYGHDTHTQTIVELGTLATARMFPPVEAKDDADVDLHDVVFTGGTHNGELTYLTFGLSDSRIAIAAIQRIVDKIHQPAHSAFGLQLND